MASGGRQGGGRSDPEPTGASEPITLTDPDGAVTRVAPWSSWTREQVRAPGGEPALVTRLDQGQLWFAAGRRRSPWRHEVHVGPAIVSTPRGRFHATAEPDGGATIACLAGRTRVVAGLREPVLLAPDQSAAVSSDGRTLVVIERAAVDGDRVINLDEEAAKDDTVLDLTDAATAASAAAAGLERDIERGLEREGQRSGDAVPAGLAGLAAAVAASGEPVSRLDRLSDRNVDTERGDAEVDDGSGDGQTVGEPGGTTSRRRRGRFGWLPDLVAVAALIALVAAGIFALGRDDPASEQAGPRARPNVASVSTTAAPTTTVAPTTTAVPTTTATPTTTAVPTTTRPRTVTSGATAVGELASCRRADGGVAATVTLSHRAGPASAFRVTVGLLDDTDQVFAQGEQTSAVIEPGGSGPVTVLVKVAGEASGACQLVGVTAA